MSQENVEIAKRGLAAINDAYAKDDISPWQQHVGKFVDPQVVIEAGADAFTEGQWRGRKGVVDFVANQMQALKEIRPGSIKQFW